jgi:putative peptide zinc metalloprotease protein
MVGLMRVTTTPPPTGLADSPWLSAQWFRVSGVKPCLSATTRVQRMSSRGELWYVLRNEREGSGNVHPSDVRVDARTWAFVGRCNGQSTLQALWDVMVAEHRDDAPSQDELLAVLSRLHAARLLEFDRPAVFARAAGVHVHHAGRADSNTPAGVSTQRSSLLSLRVPMGSPEWLLDRVMPWVTRVPVRLALWVWLALMVVAAWAAVLHIQALTVMTAQALASPPMALVGLALFVGMKFLHELGHAVVLRYHGVAVPSWGVTMLMFTPVPFVEASGASSLPHRSHRMAVSLAGILVELALASVALGVVLHVQPGWVRDAALMVFLIGTVSTLLINGNPLMRMDGYHALTDAMDLPNWATRSNTWWLEHVRLWVLGMPAPQPLQPAAGEARWLWAYAPAALLWRLLASYALVVVAGAISVVLSGVLAAVLGWGLIGAPLVKLWKFLRGTALPESARATANRRALAVAVSVAVVAIVLPLPHSSVAQGVVWLPEAALLRAQTDGLVEAVLVRDGDTVAAGDATVRLVSPELESERVALESRLVALDTERFAALRQDPERAAQLERELDAVHAAHERTLQRLDQLVVRANTPGRIVVPHAADMPGRRVKQGTLLAHVLGDAPTMVRTAVAHDQAALVQHQSHRVTVRLRSDAWTTFQASGPSLTGGTVRLLPSAALAERSGGWIATDPQDTQHLKPSRGVMLADVHLDRAVDPRVGGRAWVRFDHGHAPLAWQAARQVQQLVLQQFNPTY